MNRRLVKSRGRWREQPHDLLARTVACSAAAQRSPTAEGGGYVR